MADWQGEIDIIFSIINIRFEIMLTTGCSTHVHVSPYPTEQYTLGQLRNIMKGVAYFHAPLRTVMPAERKDNIYCKSNDKAFKVWKSLVDEVPQRSWAAIFDFFDQKLMRQHLLFDASSDRAVGWNFLPSGA